VLASSIRATQITRFRAMPTVKAGGQVVDHIGRDDQRQLGAVEEDRDADYPVGQASDDLAHDHGFSGTHHADLLFHGWWWPELRTKPGL